uniref:RRM domain-containing protein n=1 Tax=Macrostomum lignano TaxID=282301 RepID=A0A1I8J6P4_9PLAT
MASEPKRFKVEECAPSKVILIMDLNNSISDADIVALFSRYGNVVDMLRLKSGRSALLEFDDVSVSKMMVSQSKVNSFYIGSNPVKMAFGNSPNIIRKSGAPVTSLSILGYWPHPNGPAGQQNGAMMMGGPPPQHSMPPQMMQQQPPPPQQPAPVPAAPSLAIQGLPGRVLLFSITNATYPITVDVMKAICSPNGNLLRVSIGPKKADNSLEALVEFENVGDANKAIENLNGADIYSGCCTLNITVSHLPVLQVYKNDSESFDFTNPNLGAEKTPLLGSAPPQQQAPPQHPAASYQMQQPPPYQQQPPPFGGPPGMMGPQSGMPPPPQQQQQQQFNPQDMSWMFQKGEGTVVMAYNLPPGLTCQNIFNITCLYGNVARVKFLKSREGCAMVQMGTSEQSGYVVDNLSGLTIYGQKVEVCRSKQPEVQVASKPELMENGTPISVCYEDSVNNRFKRPDMFTKSRLVAPTKTLHFFNFPLGVTENDLRQFFLQHGGPLPDKAVVFKPKQQDQRAAIGLVEFDTVENAVLALMRSNHAEVKLSERAKFHAKLSFSNKPIDPADSAVVNFKLKAEQQQQQQPSAPAQPPSGDGATTISKPPVVAPNNVKRMAYSS